MITMDDIEVNVRIVSDEGSGTYKLGSGSSIRDLLESLDRNPETVVVKRNDKIVPEEEELESGDEIVVVPVVSGG